MGVNAEGYAYTAPYSGDPAVDANNLRFAWPYQAWSDASSYLGPQSSVLKQAAQNVAANYLSLATVYAELIDQIRLLQAEQAQGSSYVPPDEGEIEDDALEDTIGFDEFSPENLSLPPFIESGVRDAEEDVIDAKKKGKIDFDPYFAHKTDETDSFTPVVHQNNTFVPTVPITPFFTEETKDGSTGKHRKPGSPGR